MNSKSSFDDRWERVFQQNSWGKYPSEEAIRFTARNFYGAERSEINMLDLGCGGGATSWFLAREGFTVTAVDGSESAVAQAQALLAKDNLNATFEVVDFVSLPYQDATFDGVFDLNSIQHNRLSAIENIYSEISRVLKSGGRFLSVCLNTKTTVGSESVKLEENTYSKIDTLNHAVNTHLFTEKDLKIVEKYFLIERLETITKTSGNIKISHFIIHCLKK